MRSLARRLGAVAVTTAFVSGTALVAPQAQAANSYATSSAGWLSKQLTNGLVHNNQYDFDDYGLSLDVYLALHALDAQPAAAASVLNALDDDPGLYIGSGTERYAGATGKLATAVEQQGRDPRAYGGVNLVTRLESLVKSAPSAEAGRGVDSSTYGDYSNIIGQSFVVRALAGANSPRKADSIAFLLRQQCAAGFFRGTFESTGSSSTFTCDKASAAAPSVDGTAFAVQALSDARADGVTGLDASLAKASQWLVDHQASDGSFVGDEGTNTNTTGLAATALALTGRAPEAQRAGAWITRRQVSAAISSGSPKLARETGAIAYDSAALTTGKREGITVGLRDQWRRATAQAAIGVNAVRNLGVVAPTGYLHGGRAMTVRLTHLAPGESWTVRLGDVRTVRGTASQDGRASARVTLPKRTRTYAVRAQGSTSERTGYTRVKVVAAKTLPLSLRSRPIKRGRYQRVYVSGLQPHESARISYRGVRIWTGRATESGRVAHSFKSGQSVGTKKLWVRGRYDDRNAHTYFRVVR